MADAALDLSAKSTVVTTSGDSVRRPFPFDTPPSPRTPLKKTYTFDADVSDSDSSAAGSSRKPVSAPVTSSIRDSPCSVSDTINDKNDSLPSSPSTPCTAGRPFKSYALDSMPSVFSSASAMMFAASPSSVMAGLPAHFGLSSLYDGTSPFPSFPVTPLTSHLMQRKRRAESRSSISSANDPNSDGEGKKLKNVPEEKKDGSYWERRRKNNEAAKRSRDNRRQKEEEIAMRAAFLEQENLKLRAQVAILKNETAKLHYMLYNRI